MKKVLTIIILLSTFLITSAQSNRLIESDGTFKWQYHRSIMKDQDDSTQALITFIFINGEEQTAITYRQEVLKSSLQWISTEGGIHSADGKVECMTANLAPGTSIMWTMRLTNCENQKNIIVTEQGAILIMDKEFNVRKERFPKMTIE